MDKMTKERKEEIFDELINYLCGLDTEKCVDVLQECGVTRSEAIELEFFDFITDELPEDYEQW